LKRLVLLWGPVVLYAAAIFWASAQPDISLPSGVEDKPAHSFGYTLLAVLIVRALAGGLPRRIGLATALLGIMLTILYGLSDEFHQMFVPGREADWHDLVADAVGGCAGAALCWLWGIISRAPS